MRAFSGTLALGTTNVYPAPYSEARDFGPGPADDGEIRDLRRAFR